MARSVNLKEYLVKKIKEPKERAAYINAALEDGDLKRDTDGSSEEKF